MKKYISIVLIILLITAIVLPLTKVYAIDKNDAKNFFEVTKLEVEKTEKIEMKINLEEIKYNKFIFTLTSDINMEKVDIKEDINMEKSNNEIVIELDKGNSNLKQITLYYEIPEEKETGDKILFTATVTNIENKEEFETSDVEIIIKQSNLGNDENKEKEENQDQESENTKTESNNNKENDSITERNISQSKNNTDNFNVSNNSMQNVNSMQTRSTAQTVTYNGSDNNYLSELSIENNNLDRKFSKDSSTYFVKVGKDIEVLNILATAEEKSATVCIYGNEELREGTNKILISVTAENGNVRNYRIYVTKN